MPEDQLLDAVIVLSVDEMVMAVAPDTSDREGVLVLCGACGHGVEASGYLEGLGELVGHVCPLEDRAVVTA